MTAPRAGTYVRGIVKVLGALFHGFVAFVASFLPHSVWARWTDRFPVYGMVLPAAVLTCAAGLALGVVGYLEFAVDAASQTNAAVLEVAQNQAGGAAAEGADASAGMAASLTMLTMITYAFFTLRGLACTYLTLSGLYRALAALANDPRGDPILGLAHSATRRAAGRTREEIARIERERREGRETPDRLLPADDLGIPRAELVVIASRRKPDWTPGTVLLTRRGCFRVGDAVERETPDGLRTLYPMVEIGQAEVMRRVVRCELPRLENPLPERELVGR